MRLDMTERLPTCPTPIEKDKKLSVTMVGWDLTDQYVVTAVNDYTVSEFLYFFFFSFSCFYLIESAKHNPFTSNIDKSVECRHRKIASSNAWSYR